MRFLDISGNNLFVGGVGSASGGPNNSNLLLSPADTNPSLQFRNGTSAFGQILGASTSNRLYFDCPGEFWWRTALNNDAVNPMRLSSTELTINSGIVSLRNNTSNLLIYGGGGEGPPSAGPARSAGTKIVLLPSWAAGASVDYAIGIENTSMWFSVRNTNSSYKWYGGTSPMMTLTNGDLTLAGTITATQLISKTGGILLANDGPNIINFSTSGRGIGAPSTAGRTNGTKLVLYDGFISGSGTDYAFGIDGGVLWASVPANNARFFFRWYGGSNLWMSLSAGILNVRDGVTIGGAVATSGSVLRGDGTKFVASAIQESDLPSTVLATLNTTDATPTEIHTGNIAGNTSASWEVIVTACNTTDGNHGFSFRQKGVIARNGPTDSNFQAAAAETFTAGTDPGLSVSVEKAVGSSNISVNVTGAAAKAISWRMVLKWSNAP